MGDLTIIYTCPNGQSIAVHQQGGGGTYLGEPIDDDTDLTPGIGYDYWWSPNATNGTWADNQQSQLPAGTYTSAEDFSALDGCPVNGTWFITICDSWGGDNGYLFDWSIGFDIPNDLYSLYENPIYGFDCDSTYLESEYFVQNSDCSTSWTLPITEPGEYPIGITTTNNFGCEFSTSIPLVVFESPTPVLTEEVGVLSTGPGMDVYQWYYNGVIILGETTNSLTPSSSGEYSIEVTNSSGCTGFSDSIDFTYVGIDNIESSSYYDINFSKDNILINTNTVINYTILITSTSGKIIYSSKRKGNSSINLNDYAAGIYLLQVYDEFTIHAKKIIIQ